MGGNILVGEIPIRNATSRIKKEHQKYIPTKKNIRISCVYEINCLLLQIEIASKTIKIVSLFCLKELETK